MWFLIGSRAIQSITNDFYRNLDNSDIDLYCTKEDFQDFIEKSKLLEKCFPLKKDKYRLKLKGYNTIEVKIYHNESAYAWLAEKSQEMLLSENKYLFDHIKVNIPNLQCLKSIKESHLYWPINWVKNVEDFQWFKNKTSDIILNEKDYKFKRKIKNDMKKTHGKIPYGTLKEIPDNYPQIIQQCSPIDYEKKVIYFIHERLSLKQKINLIHKWTDFDFLLKESNNNIKKSYI